MKRKLDLVLSSCLECPYFRRIQGHLIGDENWVCYFDEIKKKLIISDKQLDAFPNVYTSGFPSFCPLEVTEDDTVVETIPVEEEINYKWVLRNALKYDLKNVSAYKNIRDGSWSFFAIRNSTGRTTDSSYEDYPSWEAVQRMFEKEYGFGAKWEKEPIKEGGRRS